MCLQETKCAEKDLPADITSMPEYPHKYWAVSDDKEGYSGVAMLCKTEPLKVNYGIGEWSLQGWCDSLVVFAMIKIKPVSIGSNTSQNSI